MPAPAVAQRLERSLVSQSLERRGAPAAGAGPVDNLPQVKHVVLLMMENHSFDNYLGMLGPAKGGFPTIVNGVPAGSNPDKDGNLVALWPRTTGEQIKHLPTQSWRGSRTQYDGGANNGFVKALEEIEAPANEVNAGMAYWSGAELPFYYSLAQTFPLATSWFSSCLGPTFPNRRFLLAGTAHGLIDDVPTGMLDRPPAGTILEVLTKLGISWTNYYDIPRLRLFASRLLGKTGVRLGRGLAVAAAALVPPLRNYVIGNLQFTANVYPLGALGALNHLRSLDKFFDDAKGGTLPFLSIVDPSFSKWSEENPQDIQLGEGFAAKVIDAVMKGPGWKDTLLLWLYDEHGGYYDHVAPPAAVPPDCVAGRCLLDAPAPVRWALQALGFWKKLEEVDDTPDRAFDQLGFRVPAVVVSPYARPGFVDNTVYDHTSVLKLIEEKWGLPPLTARDAAAVSPMAMLDFNSPPAFLTPPVLADSFKPSPV
ncbi:MAG TPA: alkaline phosphatase family protein [Acidimicrobiales bacterium]|jgi:phospholipase C|nr:alkaline phosphatase family protein [Acidimicrobiales bacterium]